MEHRWRWCLGVQAAPGRGLPQRRAGHRRRCEMVDRADRGREIDRLHAHAVPEHRRRSRCRIRKPFASSPRSRWRSCRRGSPTTTPSSSRGNRPPTSRSAAARSVSSHRSAARRSTSKPSTSSTSKGFPKLKGIKFIVYADENLRNAALAAGDVDMIEYVPWQAMSAVESNPQAEARRRRRPVHVRAVQRHQTAVQRPACPPRRRPRHQARRYRQGGILRPRQAARGRADPGRHTVVRHRSRARLEVRPRARQSAR